MANANGTNGTSEAIKERWFEKKVKAKLTTLGIILVTVAFYAVIFMDKDLKFFIYYGAFIGLFTGSFSVADVMATMSYNKAMVATGGDPSKPAPPSSPG